MNKIKLLAFIVALLVSFSCKETKEFTKEQKALLVIDMQNDFCNGGSLQVGENPDRVIPLINEEINSDKYGIVVFSKDWHPQDHVSFASNHSGHKVFETITLEDGTSQTLWPDHCVQDSVGAEFHKDLVVPAGAFVVKKGKNKLYDSYSAFQDNNAKEPTELLAYLKSKNIKEVTVVGLALDYCVYWTCKDAVKNKFDVNLLVKCTEAVAKNTGDDAIADMKKLGVNVIE